MYQIYAVMDDTEYIVRVNVSEDMLESVLASLTRKHLYKNVTRFNIRGM